MFSTADLKAWIPKYFSIIAVDDYDVTIMSKNTGHIWYIHNPEYPGEGTCIIFHKHKASKVMISGRGWLEENGVKILTPFEECDIVYSVVNCIIMKKVR